MPSMRTTLTLDPDVEQLLRREVRRTGRSMKAVVMKAVVMKAVVNDALRLGLGVRGKAAKLPPLQGETS